MKHIVIYFFKEENFKQCEDIYKEPHDKIRQWFEHISEGKKYIYFLPYLATDW